MLNFGMPMLPLQSPDQAARICRRLGLNFIEQAGQDGLLRLSQSMDNAEREALIAQAEAQQLPVLLEADTLEELEASVLWLNLWRNRMCEPDELWDVYDENCRLTGRTHLRREPLRPDEYHLCVHVWTRNSRGKYLLTRRSMNKSLPGLWETTGGSVVAGEDSFSAAIREVREETGIELEPAAGKFLFRYGGVSFFCDVWLFEQDFDLDAVQLLEGETCGKMAADKETIRRLLAEDMFVDYEYIDDFLNE